MYRRYLSEHAVKDASVVSNARLVMRRLLLAVSAPVIAVRGPRRGRRRQLLLTLGLVRNLDPLDFLLGDWAQRKVLNVFLFFCPPPRLLVLGARGSPATLGRRLWV